MVTFMNEPELGASLGAAELIPKPVDWDRLKTGDGPLPRRRRAACWWWTTTRTPARGCARCWNATAGRWIEAENGQAALWQVDRVRAATGAAGPDHAGDGRLRLPARAAEPAGCRDIPVVVLTARDLSASDRMRLDTADRVLSKGARISLRDLAGEVRALRNPADSQPR